MPELWIPSGGTNRKIRELYIPSGGVTRKIKEAYAPFGGSNRKIFSSGVGYSLSVSASTANGGYANLSSDGTCMFYAVSNRNDAPSERARYFNWYMTLNDPIPIDLNKPILKMTRSISVSGATRVQFISYELEATAKLEGDTNFYTYTMNRVTGDDEYINSGTQDISIYPIVSLKKSGFVRSLHLNYGINTPSSDGVTVTDRWKQIEVYGVPVLSAPTGQLNIQL